jgi:hypothetical protein
MGGCGALQTPVIADIRRCFRCARENSNQKLESLGHPTVDVDAIKEAL